MKEMTTAEFAKANLAAIEEPVSIRRYTKVVGTYYPTGFEPIKPDLPRPQVDMGLADPDSGFGGGAQARVNELEEEVAMLKRQLAARPTTIGATTAFPRSPKGGDDPFAGLAKQDRDFFERKLGKKK